MSEKIGILVDLGNSETRVSIVRNGVMHDLTLSNRFVKLDGGYKIPPEYRRDTSTIFRQGGLSFANGYIVNKEFSSKAIKPNAIQSKTDQRTTMLSLNLIFIKAFMYLSEITDCPIENLDVSFELRLLLPPSEHDKKADEMKQRASTITQVECFTPKCFKKDVNIENIVILPEGGTAFIGGIYEGKNGQMNIIPKNQTFATDDCLIIDIGAGTTDIVLIRDGEIVVDSKETFHKGGNNIESACKKSLYKEYDYSPDERSMKTVLEEGVLHKGTEIINVESYLNKAKEEFGQELKNFLIDYLQRNDVEIRALKGLLVLGGGALPATRDGKIVSASMATVLVDFIHEITDSVALIDTSHINPRYLNLNGLKLYYTYVG
jgi:hypothetical protein